MFQQGGSKLSSRWIAAAVVVTFCLASVVGAASTATAASGPPSIASGPAFGFVPSHNANQAKGKGHLQLLTWHGGPVKHSTKVVPVYWGTSWGNSTFVGDKMTGLGYFYSHVGGSGYAHTNSEYYDGTDFVNTTLISTNADLRDSTATPSGAPSTTQVLAAVARATSNNPIANAYYPVYSDKPRGSAGYCAWHSSGTINGIEVQFGFFFNLDGDPGCDPQATGTGHSQGLSALANVSGHELSEMLTDPELNAWYDQRGSENSDKCAWTFDGNVTIGTESWKIQGNWSNAAANANSGYANGGCIQTS
jgi:hypothetical protein